MAEINQVTYSFTELNINNILYEKILLKINFIFLKKFINSF